MSATDAIGPIRHTLSDETRRILSAPLFTNTHISIVEKMCIITVIQCNLDWISSLLTENYFTAFTFEVSGLRNFILTRRMFSYIPFLNLSKALQSVLRGACLQVIRT